MPTGKNYRIGQIHYAMPSSREVKSWLDRHGFHVLLAARPDDLNGLKVHRGQPSYGGERDHIIIQSRYDTHDEAFETTMRVCNALWKREWDIKLVSATEIHVYGRPPSGFHKIRAAHAAIEAPLTAAERADRWQAHVYKGADFLNYPNHPNN